MRNPNNDTEFNAKKIVIRRYKTEVPYYATLRIPSHPFLKTKRRIEEVH
jgi:hypothetical protein